MSMVSNVNYPVDGKHVSTLYNTDAPSLADTRMKDRQKLVGNIGCVYDGGLIWGGVYHC